MSDRSDSSGQPDFDQMAQLPVRAEESLFLPEDKPIEIRINPGNAWSWLWLIPAIPIGIVTLFIAATMLALADAAFPAATLAFGLAFGLSITVLCIVQASKALQDKVIKLYSTELRFNSCWNRDVMGRRIRPWSDVHSIDFSGTPTPSEVSDWHAISDNCITINFKSGGSIMLELGRLKRSGLEQLFMGLEKWCDQSVLSKRALVLERYLIGLNEDIPASYTAIWTDALDAQFSSTRFVPLRSGAKLANGLYQVRLQLTSGGLSAIYLARQLPDTTVVLKESVLPSRLDEKAMHKAKALFERQAQLLARLNHPHVAKVLDSFCEDGRDYIVLEYIAGASLRQLVQTRKPTYDKVALWAEQIAEILDYLHTLEPPLIHRDLTPDNLLLRDDGQVVLIDFGASNEYIGKATGTLVGKQAYIPPEQFRGKAEPSSDIYAFGATLYFLLTGCDPEPLCVSRPSSQERQAPEGLDMLVVNCTQLEPSKRPSAKELITACKRLNSKAGYDVGR